MKRIILLCLTVCVVACTLLYIILFTPYVQKNVPIQSFHVDGNEILKDEEPFTIKGISLGTGYPGYFPNESGIEKTTYERWFSLMADMNVNTIRVYKQQSPDFYQAFKNFNEKSEKKLYLLQGVDFSEKMMYSSDNILSDTQYEQLEKDVENLVDVLHGNHLSYDSENRTMNAYTADVSDYVMGYILGIEWDEMFVEYTTRINSHIKGWDGKYLSTGSEANGFETFLAKWGNDLLAYEDSIYQEQKLISFCNWPLTDPLKNEFELKPNPSANVIEDSEAFIDIDHIHVEPTCSSGIFASYNVYPYYPYFLQYGEYTEGVDAQGNPDPYLTYLKELVNHHKYPVIITEFGAPSSRSATYEERWQGIHHGGLNEKEQAEALKKMYEDIQNAGCDGSIVFSWQDEWYKKAWNERELSNSDERQNWANAECSEQGFGVLAFEPGEENTTFYPDGNLGEWEKEHEIYQNGRQSISMHSDEKYVYILIKDPDIHKNSVTIGLDVHPTLGEKEYRNIQFTSDVDFVLDIHPSKKATLKVFKEYDPIIYSALGGYGEQSIYIKQRIKEEVTNKFKNSEPFHTVSRAKGNIQDTLNLTWSVNPVGNFVHGNANPQAREYNSNADFYMNQECVEIRIPWQLLNFYDPSHQIIMDDFQDTSNPIKPLKIDAIQLEYYDGNQVHSNMKYKLHRWKKPTYHERLKESYYVLQDLFKDKETSSYANS